MSKIGFYREWLTFTLRYRYTEGGQQQTGHLPFVYVRGNVQPWKSGLSISVEEIGSFFTGYKVAYVKTVPVWDLDLLPPGASITGTPLFFHKGNWYETIGLQDWTTQAKNPKHTKYLAFRQTGSGAIVLPEPVPVAELVDAFERVVSKLHQITPTITEVL